MKNIKKCSVCGKSEVRVLLAGKFVNSSHQEWRGDRVCPNCRPKSYDKGECKGCGKMFSIHFEGKQYCSKTCYTKNKTQEE